MGQPKIMVSLFKHATIRERFLILYAPASAGFHEWRHNILVYSGHMCGGSAIISSVSVAWCRREFMAGMRMVAGDAGDVRRASYHCLAAGAAPAGIACMFNPGAWPGRIRTEAVSIMASTSSTPISPDHLRRTVVIGTSCSGKTTFAGRLAILLGVRHIELDELHWAQGWVERDDEDFRARARGACAGERWVSDGNYGQVRDIVWPRATAVIWLNYRFPLVLYRCLVRTIRRAVTREELFSGNRESFRMSFMSRDSIILWVIRTHHRRRRAYPALLADPAWSHLHVIVLTSPAETERFLHSVLRC